MPGKTKRQEGQRKRRGAEAKLPPQPKLPMVRIDDTDETDAALTARLRDERREYAEREYRVRQLLTRREPDFDASKHVRKPSSLAALPSDVLTVARCACAASPCQISVEIHLSTPRLPSQVRRWHPSRAELHMHGARVHDLWQRDAHSDAPAHAARRVQRAEPGRQLERIGASAGSSTTCRDVARAPQPPGARALCARRAPWRQPRNGTAQQAERWAAGLHSMAHSCQRESPSERPRHDV